MGTALELEKIKVQEGIKAGIAVGIVQGLGKGIEKGIEKAALYMLKRDVDENFISYITGLSIEQIEALQ